MHYNKWLTISIFYLYFIYSCLLSRDIIKWLFSAIMKSTEHGESREADRERDEQIRWITKKLFRNESFVLECNLTQKLLICIFCHHGCFCACPFRIQVDNAYFLALSPLQNGVHPPEDAVSGSGGRPLSSSQLCQVVPGALPYAHQQCAFTSTQVRRRDESEEGKLSRFSTHHCER